MQSCVEVVVVEVVVVDVDSVANRPSCQHAPPTVVNMIRTAVTFLTIDLINIVDRDVARAAWTVVVTFFFVVGERLDVVVLDDDDDEVIVS